jgi:hypothetical protein
MSRDMGGVVKLPVVEPQLVVDLSLGKETSDSNERSTRLYVEDHIEMSQTFGFGFRS